MEEIGRRTAAIAGDTDHGATFLAMEAVWVLAAAAKGLEPGPDWQGHLATVADRLAAAKPAMASVGNAAQRLLGELVALGPQRGPPRAGALARRLVAAMRAACEAAAVNAAGLIDCDAAVATCSYSSAVLRTARRALAGGKSPRVLVLEPAHRPPSAGHRLAEEMEEMGLTVEVLGSSAAVARLASVAITGADAVSPGWVVNGSPTLELAQAAKAARVPFYVVCERIKFTREVADTPGYDLVPMELVRGVVTEEGGAPRQVGAVTEP